MARTPPVSLVSFVSARLHAWHPWPLLFVLHLGFVAQPAALVAQRGGVHLDYGALLARPYLDDNSGEVFEQVGRFRPGLGVRVGIGYDIRRFGATLFAEFAGIEIGPERERDGINMGRESGILRSYGLAAEWRPARRVAAWQPVLSAGYLRQGVDNVLLARDQLPAYARDSTVAPGDASTRPAGVAGSGVRLSGSLDRVLPGAGLPGRLVLRASAGGDLVRFTRVRYDFAEWPIPGSGWGLTPHLSFALQWSPGAPSSDPANVRR